jgi:hypothetical protein
MIKRRKVTNDVKAGSLSIITTPTGNDGTGAPTAIQIVPRLVDAAGKPVSFTGAGLEATLSFQQRSKTFYG